MNRSIVKSNTIIAKDTYKMILESSTAHAAGQFVEVQVADSVVPFLRRPISVSDQTDSELTLVYKVFGSGTRLLSEVKAGSSLDILHQLGNGFSIHEEQSHVVLIGGGVGVPPLLLLAKTLKEQGKTMDIILGFATKDDVFYEKELSEFGSVHIATLDGTKGIKGNVIDVLRSIQYDYYYAVGPLGMLKALQRLDMNGELSLEERMGCGFGACMGCSIMTTEGAKRVCVDGPVFKAEVLSWED